MSKNGKAAAAGGVGDVRPNEENHASNSFNPTIAQLIEARKDAERMTDLHGATLYRCLVWPQKRLHNVGYAFPDQVECLRDIVAGGDMGLVQGPLEVFVVLTGSLAIECWEAMR